MIDLCENCIHFNWEQAAKLFGHPCNLHLQKYDCEDYFPKDICKDCWNEYCRNNNLNTPYQIRECYIVGKNEEDDLK